MPIQPHMIYEMKSSKAVLEALPTGLPIASTERAFFRGYDCGLERHSRRPQSRR